MLLKEIRKTIREKILLLETFDKIIKELREELPFSHLSIFIHNEIIIRNVKNLGELHRVRNWLRCSLGRWNDKKGMIWHSSDLMLCEFCSQDLPVTIWLETYVENFPKELQGDKCKIVKLPDTTHIESHYKYVCEE